MNLLAGELTRAAFCWTVERRDGAGLALTSFDRAIERGGVSYQASPGMMPAAIVRRSGLDPATSEIGGAVTSRALSAADLTAGRWDGAAARLTAVDWGDAAAEPVVLAAGEIGEVAIDGERFSTELRGAAARLDAAICPMTSPMCRAEFGDDQCRVDLAGRTVRARVVASAGDRLTLDTAVDGRFLFGRLRFLEGSYAGLTSAVWASAGVEVRLRAVPADAVVAGTMIELREGCDKLMTTCSGRFANAVNFRGEPHVPGNDLLLRYPGQ